MFTLIASVIALAMVIAVLSPAEAGSGSPIQTITGKLSPEKRSKKKAHNARMYFELLTGPNSSDPDTPEQPPAASRIQINLPKNVKINTKAVPHCDVSADKLDNTTSEQALNLCGEKSRVSVGGDKIPDNAEHSSGTSAWVTVDLPGEGLTLGAPIRVVALNGNRKNQIFLHARSDTFNITTVLVGEIDKGPKGYGQQLDFSIPPLAAGALSRLTVTLKNKGYVKASCRSKSERWQVKSAYSDHAPSSDSYRSSCKRKRRHH